MCTWICIINLFQPPQGIAVLQKEKELRTRAESLRKEKKERLRILGKLQQDDQVLCDKMCMTPYYIPSGSTPTGSQLEELRQHVEKLTKEQVHYCC